MSTLTPARAGGRAVGQGGKGELPGRIQGQVGLLRTMGQGPTPALAHCHHRLQARSEHAGLGALGVRWLPPAWPSRSPLP